MELQFVTFILPVIPVRDMDDPAAFLITCK